MPDPITPQAEVRQIENETVRALKAVALRSIERYRELKETKKLIAEQKKALFEKDNDVAEAVKEAEEYVEAVKEEKERVKNTKSYVDLETKGKDVQAEMKELTETINGHLFEYSKITGQNHIEDADGKQLRIKHQVQVKSGQLRLF